MGYLSQCVCVLNIISSSSVDELQQSTSGSMIGNHGNQDPEEFTYLTLQVC